MLARSVDSDYQRYVLSLEILFNAEASMFLVFGAMLVAASMTRCNSSAGVLDHIKGRAGNTGTQEGLTSPRRTAVSTDGRNKNNPNGQGTYHHPAL